MKIEDALKISTKVRKSHWHLNDWIEVTSVSQNILFIEDDWEPFVEPKKKQTSEVWEWRFWDGNCSWISDSLMSEGEVPRYLEIHNCLGMEKLRGPFIIEVD